MKVKTKQPVSTQQWLEQVGRFAKVSKQTPVKNHPVTDVTNLHAEIHIEIDQPLTMGFKAKVTYYQIFDKPADQTTTRVTNKIVQYVEQIPRDDLNTMIDAYKNSIPNTITKYLDKQDWIIEQGVLNQIVSKHTFGGLKAEDYIIEK